mgnify:CR=1 FL=1
MVAGDVVQGVSAVGAAIQFQPASGVQCMISTTSAGSGIGYTTLRDASGSVTIYQFPNSNNLPISKVKIAALIGSVITILTIVQSVLI